MTELAAVWMAAWPRATAIWSRYARLSPPRLCFDDAAAKKEGLGSGFAMIRLSDHAVVINLADVVRRGLADAALPVLAHEVGHHVYAPADLADNARLLGRIRRALGPAAGHAPLVSNLYSDLLINDRLHREEGLDVLGVYRILGRSGPPEHGLFRLYLRIYERLWERRAGELAGPVSAELDTDALLGARLIRAWRLQWLRGASRFAMLVRPYLQGVTEEPAWGDTLSAGAGGGIPDGILSDDDDEDMVHPAEEAASPEPSGRPGGASPAQAGAAPSTEPDNRSGRGPGSRGPAEYLEILRAAGASGSREEQVARYYRELSRPYLVPFPSRVVTRAREPIPEGLDRWELGDPLPDLDWLGSLVQNPRVIPGVTTARRVESQVEGRSRGREVPDLFLGVDCSGSMPNPAAQLSYPVLAGAVLLGSALRAGASVMVTLSGESPGSWTSTNAFGRAELPALEVLTRHLGTGYAFGVERLRAPFIDGPPRKKPAHLIIISDTDLFVMIRRTPDGEALMRGAAERAGGGATAVLRLAGGYAEEVGWLNGLGWDVAPVADLPALLTFARHFSRRTFGQPPVARSRYA